MVAERSTTAPVLTVADKMRCNVGPNVGARCALFRKRGSTMPLSVAEDARLALLAMDVDDLAVISANLQDARIAVADLIYLPAEKRFALAGKRFDWIKAAAGGCERAAMGLHFERVLAVERAALAQEEGERVLNLLAIEFEPVDEPAGRVVLIFSGGTAIRLDVECIEAQMRDLGPRFPCDKTPAHPLEA